MLNRAVQDYICRACSRANASLYLIYSPSSGVLHAPKPFNCQSLLNENEQRRRAKGLGEPPSSQTHCSRSRMGGNWSCGRRHHAEMAAGSGSAAEVMVLPKLRDWTGQHRFFNSDATHKVQLSLARSLPNPARPSECRPHPSLSPPLAHPILSHPAQPNPAHPTPPHPVLSRLTQAAPAQRIPIPIPPLPSPSHPIPCQPNPIQTHLIPFHAGTASDRCWDTVASIKETWPFREASCIRPRDRPAGSRGQLDPRPAGSEATLDSRPVYPHLQRVHAHH